MPRLNRVAATVTKDKNPGVDAAQVPAAATVKLYKTGAIVSANVTINSGASGSISVYDIGRIKTGDTIQKEASGTVTATVGTITSRTTIPITNVSGGNLVLVAGDAVVATTDRPTTYDEPSGTDGTSVGNEFSTSASTGHGEAYTKDRSVFAIVSGTGVTSRLIREIGEQTGPMKFLSEFRGNLQDAINYFPGGRGTIVIDEWVDITSIAPIVIDSKPALRLIGLGALCKIQAGPNTGLDPAYGIYSTDATKKVLHVKNSPYNVLEGFNIKGAASGNTFNANNVGIHYDLASPETILPGITMRNMHVHQCAGDGVQIENAYLSTFDYCQFTFNNGKGFSHTGVSPGSPHQLFTNCWFLSNLDYGYYANNVGIVVHMGCSYQNNGRYVTSAPGATIAASQMYMQDSGTTTLMNCQWEEIDAALSRIGFEGYRLSNFEIVGNSFINLAPSSLGVSKGMLFHDIHNSRIQNNFFNHLDASGGGAGIALHLVHDGSSLSRNCTIGDFWMPNGNIKPLEGTEDTNFKHITISQMQHYADTGSSVGGRDHAVGASNKNPVFKTKGQIIYVHDAGGGTPKHQRWDGSAWANMY